ncbi:acetyl-CoA C-acetyltransferase [Arcicella rosea]|uniref:Acetyl-CoA C-acetyltransferase n=1 Tax=Arcicella rosea TaxID=502909 RepID=A0A841EN79_9BACT|nr:acetyl-CoA C-acetyltransferase [Arcicella rosea]MBB6002188.1 acetyl-CoA C-acetyltransferase [Arcicella rosea]
MNVAYIYDAVRTPRGRGKSDGSLHDIQPVQLAQQVLQQLRERNQLDTSLVDDVILGCVTPIGEQGADIARTAVLAAGYDQSVAGVQINRFCSSGLEAVNMAAAYIMSGQQELIIAGGIESMSRVAMGSDGGAMMMNPALIAEHKFVPQGISADLIATKYGYSREFLDSYAVASQQKAAFAQQNQRFSKSMFAVKDDIGQEVLTFDEGMRPDTSLDSLAKLKPAFETIGQMGLDHLALMKYPELNEIKHLHHAGNSSQIVDGAAGILIGNKAIGEKLGLKPRAKITAFGVSGSEPTIMLTGPIPATQKVLKRNGMNISDIDLFEINEAFAAIPLLFMDVLKVDASKVNVNGGAIALGHPLGATGAIILMTLLDELERTGKSTGLASLCIGGGMGIATVIERV